MNTVRPSRDEQMHLFVRAFYAEAEQSKKEEAMAAWDHGYISAIDDLKHFAEELGIDFSGISGKVEQDVKKYKESEWAS